MHIVCVAIYSPLVNKIDTERHEVCIKKYWKPTFWYKIQVSISYGSIIREVNF